MIQTFDPEDCVKLQTVAAAVVLLVCVLGVKGQVADWYCKMKQIRILRDSYEDVVKLLGTPVDGTTKREFSEYFDFPTGRMWVGFETGDCIAGPDRPERIGWNVKPFTVIEIGFSPDEWIDPKALGVDLRGFTAKRVLDQPKAVEYSDEDSGTVYVGNIGRIQNVTIRPRRDQFYRRCKP